MKKTLIFFTLFILVHLDSYSQEYSIKYFNLDGNIDAWFKANFDSANVKPMIGALPIVSPPRRRSSVFFVEKSQDWVTADLTYDSHFYSNAKLRYDLEKQVIYILNPLSLQPITLNQNLVNKIETELGVLKARKDSKGYYLVLSKGNNFSLIKESSKHSVVEGTEFQYQRVDKYYLLFSDRKEVIVNARSLLKRFPDYKKEIKKFMRTKESRQLKTLDKEKHLIHIAEYCDSIITS